MVRRRGRRVRSHDRRAASAGCGRTERRARPSQRVRIARGVAGSVRRLDGTRSARRPRGGARARRLRPRVARRAQQAQRCCGSRGARAVRCRTRRGEAARHRVRGRGAPVPAARRRRRRFRLRRLRPPSDRGRCDDLDRARAGQGQSARPLPAAPLLAHAAPCARVRSRARGRRRGCGGGRVRGARARRRRPRQGRRGRGVGCTRRCTRRVDAVARGGRALAREPRSPRRRRAHGRRGRRRRSGAGAARGARVKIERDVPLARYTTLGTGGPARFFARPETLAELEEALGFAEQEGPSVAVVGLGSNLLAADDGVDRVVIRLAGELAAVMVDGELVSAGGGATNAVVLHRARESGLGGFEFACAIPGTTGGGVWMNAGAYGGDFAQVLERALVVTASGSAWLTAEELGLTYRHSSLEDGHVVAQVELRLTPRPVDEIKATVSELQAKRKAAQPTNKRTFGSVFKNPQHELTAGRMLEACGLRGHRIGGAQISPRHANFIENADSATSADAIELMAEARRRAWESYGVELVHEVEFLGPLELPSLR